MKYLLKLYSLLFFLLFIAMINCEDKDLQPGSGQNFSTDQTNIDYEDGTSSEYIANLKVIDKFNLLEDQGVDVFFEPQIQFKHKVNKIYSVNEEIQFRTNIKYFTIKDETGKIVDGELVWGADSLSVSFKAREALPEKQTFKVEVKAYVEVYEEGKWKFFEGKEEETYVFTFKTDKIWTLKVPPVKEQKTIEQIK
jgi:hypothetical protein